MKNTRFSAVFKLLAFVMAAACIVIMYYHVSGLNYGRYGMDAAKYIDSQALGSKLHGKISPYWVKMAGWESREAVQRGDYVTAEMIRSRKITVASDKTEAKKRIHERYYNEYWFLNPENKLGDNIDTYTAEFRTSVLEAMNAELDALETKYDMSEEALQKTIIAEQLSEYQDMETALKDLRKYGYFYYLRGNGKIQTNTTLENFEKLPAKVYLRMDTNAEYDGLTEKEWETGILNSPNPPGTIDVVVAMGESRFAKAEKEYLDARAAAQKAYVYLTASGFVLLLCTVWLIYAAGRRVDAPGVHLIWLDHIPLDIALAGAFLGVALTVGVILASGLPYRPLDNLPADLIILSALYGAYLLAVAFFTMFAKRARRHEVLSHTLIYKVLRLIYRTGRSVAAVFLTAVNGGSLARKLLLPMSGYGFATLILVAVMSRGGYYSAFFFFLGLGGLALLNYFAFKYLTQFVGSLRILAHGVKNIKAGDLNYQITPLENTEINLIAQDVNTITEGLKAAVESELKSERMKVELVTNVSHDIKTPLTSVINYSALLAEENLPEPAAEYAKILKSKSQRLKNLIDDLFLVSKAQSGAVDIHMEPLCLNEILTQALAEYAETFEEAELQTRVRASAPKIMAAGDGATGRRQGCCWHTWR